MAKKCGKLIYTVDLVQNRSILSEAIKSGYSLEICWQKKGEAKQIQAFKVEMLKHIQIC